MKSKTLLYIASGLMVWILLATACSSGYLLGQRTTATPTPVSTPADADELFAPFWQAWDLVHKLYVDQPVDDDALMRGAIKGMLEALNDQHTSYMDPVEYKDATSYLEGEYEGIGAWVNTDAEFLTINSPMPGSPAEKAGLQPGDQVIAIDGEDMTGVDPELVRLRVLGPKGSQVILTIRREGVEEPFDVEIQRATIIVPSVESRMLAGNIAYVHLFSFGDKTTTELRDALADLMAQNPAGLILDLRNNGGGELQTAIDVASEFIGDGVIMYEAYGDGRRETFEARQDGQATEIPMVVLINEWSASASEIVAGAIQDRGRGPLVGVTSFGKGTVQNWIPLVNDQGAARITIARWLTPNERNIHQIGLTPDYVVERTNDDIQANLDPQLDKAVELLTQK
jgi:carboxyl-terminal processing protease